MVHPLKRIARAFPQSPGVYLFKHQATVLYVGKAINLRSRTLSYFTGQNLPKTEAMIAEATKLDHILVSSELEALLLETKLIQKFQPRYNLRSKDDKSPLYITFTRDKLPRIILDRKRNLGQKDVFFGPFQTTRQVRHILKILRRVFPFCSTHEVRGKACFYSHLGLCQPCPNVLAGMPESSHKAMLIRHYLGNITALKRVLSGRSDSLLKAMKTKLQRLTKAEQYEEAAVLRDQINALDYLVNQPINIAGYLANPQLLEDIRDQEAYELQQFITHNTPYAEVQTINRIEAYDISRSGTDVVVGAMVVFVNGEPDKASYRKFRIRDKSQVADPKYLQEVLRRRLGHTEWPMPDLILLDGGTPQVNAIRKLFETQSVSIPLLGLAKGAETLCWYAGGIKHKQLPLSSPALKLLQRLRDEAHRFSHGYQVLLKHRQLRS